MSGATKSDGMSEPVFWGYLFGNLEIMPLGWYEMKVWDDGFNQVLKDANKMAEDLDTVTEFPIRGDLIEDYISDLEYLIKCRDGKYENY